MQYWLIKSEPSEISIDDMAGFSNQTIEWYGIRNLVIVLGENYPEFSVRLQ